MKPAIVYSLLAILAQLFLALACRAAEPPNFVVILTDDQSWVGSSLQMLTDDARSKSDYYQTPNIERLAATGMVFSQGYAPAASCSPTRRSLLIGQNPARHIYNKDQRNWTRYYREQLSIPQLLKSANSRYQTAHFGKWDMRFDLVTPEEMGYDSSDGYTENDSGQTRGGAGTATNEDPKLLWSITERAGNFMSEQAKSGNPFYVQVSYYAVHLDISYRAQTLQEVNSWPKGERHSMSEFAAMTKDMDTNIGILLDKIETLGLRNNTYIFFLSDNGGRDAIPGQIRNKGHQNFPLRNGKHYFYEGGIRVPFIVAGPGIDKKIASAIPVSGLDILPTVADLAGYPNALPDNLDGGSMTPILFQTERRQVARVHPFLIFHQSVDRFAQTALIMENYKLVKSWSINRLELFDISKDIGETTDLSEQLPDKVAQLDSLMEKYLDDVGAEVHGRDKAQNRHPHHGDG